MNLRNIVRLNCQWTTNFKLFVLPFSLNFNCLPSIQMVINRLLQNILLCCIIQLLVTGLTFAQKDALTGEAATSAIIFDFNVDSAFVQFHLNNPAILKVADEDTVYLKNGFYHLFLSYPTNKDKYITQNVLRDSVYSISHEFDLTRNQIDLKRENASIRYLIGGDLVALSDSSSKIKVGENQSSTGFGIFDLGREQQKLTFSNPKFRQKEFVVKRSEEVLYESYFFNSKDHAVSTIDFIPGIYQFRNKEYLKTGLIISAFAISSSFALKYQLEYKEQLDLFQETRSRYLLAEYPSLALELGNEMEQASNRLKPYLKRRNYSLLAIFGVFAIDAFDKIRSIKKNEEKNTRTFELFLKPVFDEYISAGAKIKF